MLLSVKNNFSQWTSHLLYMLWEHVNLVLFHLIHILSYFTSFQLTLHFGHLWVMAHLMKAESKLDTFHKNVTKFIWIKLHQTIYWRYINLEMCSVGVAKVHKLKTKKTKTKYLFKKYYMYHFHLFIQVEVRAPKCTLCTKSTPLSSWFLRAHK